MTRSVAEPVAPRRVAELAQQALSSRVEAVAALLREAVDRDTPDPEQIHQLRVATRRAAVALKVFRDLLPISQAAWWNRTLKDLRHSTDAARDDDVLTERLQQEPSGSNVAALLRRGLEHRRAAQRPLVEMADRLLGTCVLDCALSDVTDQLTAVAKSGDEAVDLRRWAVNQLKPFRSRFRKASRRNLHDGARLHRFRIRTKQLRYALELLAEQLPADAVPSAQRTIEKLQDRLGTANDHRAAAERFFRWQADAEDPDEVEYLEENGRAEQDAFRAARKRALDWWKRHRKRLKHELRAAVDRTGS